MNPLPPSTLWTLFAWGVVAGWCLCWTYGVLRDFYRFWKWRQRMPPERRKLMEAGLCPVCGNTPKSICDMSGVFACPNWVGP